MSVLIGLVGSAGAGKDAFAQRLTQGYGYERFAFADQMRNLLLTLDPLVTDSLSLSRLVNHYGWDVTKRTYPEVRRLLQVFGTDVVRNGLGQDVWVNAARDTIEGWLEDGYDVVVTDVRFLNEANLITELGGSIIRIDRLSADEVTDPHVSEHEWRTVRPAMSFTNDEGIPELHAKADLLVKLLQAAA